VFNLLFAVSLFDKWAKGGALANSAGSFTPGSNNTINLSPVYINLRLWIIPAATLLFAIFTIILYRFTASDRSIAILYLIVGILVLFYPGIRITFSRFLNWLPIPNYFSRSIIFYAGAWLAAIGFANSIKLTPKV